MSEWENQYNQICKALDEIKSEVKEKNQILEITGTFDILPKKGKHRVVKELSKFKIIVRS